MAFIIVICHRTMFVMCRFRGRCVRVGKSQSIVPKMSLHQRAKKSTNYSDAYDTLLYIILTIVRYLFTQKLSQLLFDFNAMRQQVSLISCICKTFHSATIVDNSRRFRCSFITFIVSLYVTAFECLPAQKKKRLITRENLCHIISKFESIWQL